MATDETNYNNPYMRSPGLNDAGSYLVSGKPYYTGSAILTGEEVRFAFPAVTKEIVVQGTNVLMQPLPSTSPGYNAAHSHYFTINQNTVYTFDMKCNEIIFKAGPVAGPGSVEVYASLTGINQAYMFPLTGSGIATD
tara:strand:- start:228 stop:638 length:411 start_codon:yes stop_codon:yes gene_type:complete